MTSLEEGTARVKAEGEKQKYECSRETRRQAMAGSMDVDAHRMWPGS